MAKINFAETSNKQMKNASDVSDCSIDPDNSMEDKLGHQSSVIMNPDVASTSKSHSVKKRMKYNISSTSIGVINTLRYKVLIGFVMCCITGCCLIPIITYSVYQIIDNDGTDAERSKNPSTKVCFMCYSK